MPPPKENEFEQLLTDVITKAKKMGASAAEADICTGNGFTVNVRHSAAETIEHNQGKELGVTVYFGKRTGTAITSAFTPSAIQLLLEKACHIAKFVHDDPFVGLADPELMAYDYPDLKLFYPWNISIEEAIELAKNCEAAGFKLNRRITNTEGTSVSAAQVYSAYGNSHGFIGKVFSSRHTISCAFIAADKNEMRRDYYYTAARDPNDLESINVVAKSAVNRTIQRLHAKHGKTCKAPVIFIAETAGSLIASFLSAISGGNLYRKTSFLLDHLEKPVFAKCVNISEQPLIPKGMASAPFDGEGVRIRTSDIVVDGVLKRYLLDSYSARKLNLQTTGNSGGTHNIVLKTGNLNLKDLLKKMQKGLLITETMGQGINIVTGDYSRGAFGYWVENGEIQNPIEGITIAGNLKDIFFNIVEIGNDIDKRSSILTGSILVDNMTIAGH